LAAEINRMRNLFILLLLFIPGFVFSQKLQPGFDAKEYAELLSLSFHSSSIPDSVERKKTKDHYHLEYRSEEVGLLNRWSFYLRDDNVAVLNIRGTVQRAASWMENFYAAMIPATGSLQINDSTTFNYQLSADPKAMVHTGWTIGLAFLAPGIEKKIIDYYKQKQLLPNPAICITATILILSRGVVGDLMLSTQLIGFRNHHFQSKPAGSLIQPTRLSIFQIW
jgi:hypothetical protein